MMRSRDGHTGAGRTWLARATVLAVGAATLTVPLGIMTGAEAARIQPRNGGPTSTLAVIKTINVGANTQPKGVAVNNEDDTVYVANSGTNTVSVINGRNTDDSRTIPVGNFPEGIAVDQNDDTVYVANYGPDNVSVINGRTTDDSRTVTVGVNPVGVAVNSLDDTVYVTNSSANTVSVIDGRNPSGAPSTISVGLMPQGVAVNQDDDTVYVTNFNGGNVANSHNVSVINGRTGQRTDDTVTVGTNPVGVAVNSLDDTVYVTNFSANTVSVINGRTGQRTDDTISVGNNPRGVAADQGDGTVYVTNYFANTVSVINGRTGQRTDDTVTVGTYPRAVAVDDSGTNAGLVYVANEGNPGTVSVIGRVTPTLASPSGAAGSTATVTVTVPNLASGFTMDDSTITSVTFGTTVFTTGAGLTAASGNNWTFTVPAGSGTVAVTVKFNGSSATVSAGNFTYGTSPGPTPPAPTPATAPLDVTATAGDAAATVTWKAPASSGDYPITTYKAVSSPGGRICLVAVPALTCEVTGLTNGTAYTFTVQALTGAGWGATSTPSNAVTPTAPPRPTITITGSRDGDRIVVTGTSTELAGKTLRPWIRFPGQTSYTEGIASITPSADGRFTWSRKTGKKAYVYIAHEETRSNTVIIPAR